MFIPKSVIKIINTLNSNGYEGFMVGGCVRDYILGIEPHDYDITTNARPETIIKLFSNYNVIPTGIRYGTVTIMIDHIPYEVTTYRNDGNYTDGRRPDQVTFSDNIFDDLKRRDFTINSMAFNPVDNKFIDPYNGREDLANKIVKCVGNPNERFIEDGLRIMRAVRFATKFNFTIEKNTFDSIVSNVHMLKPVSEERIQDEFNKIVMSNNISNGIKLLCTTDIMNTIIPEFIPMINCYQNHPNHNRTVFEHTLKCLENSLTLKGNLEFRLSVLFHDIGKPKCKTTDESGQDHFFGHPEKGFEMVDQILRRLKYSNKTRIKVSNLVREHDYSFPESIGRFKKDLKSFKSSMDDYFKIRTIDIEGQSSETQRNSLNTLTKVWNVWEKVIHENQPYKLEHLKVNGNDILDRFNITGKLVKEYLDYALEQVIINPSLNQKERLISLLEKRFV